MADIVSKIETFYCGVCDYHIDIDQQPSRPKQDPFTPGFMERLARDGHFIAHIILEGVGAMHLQPGECPACFMNGVFPVPTLAREIRPEFQAEMTVKDPNSVADEVKLRVVGVDTAEGRPVVEKIALSRDDQDKMIAKINLDLERLALMEYDPKQVG